VYTWKQAGYPHLLLAATQRGDLSYERRIDGRWRGLLTWAATTVLGQWATGGDLGATAYPALAVDELVKRATALIAAIQPTDDERQAPVVIASPEALAVPFLATAAGTLTAQPAHAPGHEWDAGSMGNIIDKSTNTTIGQYYAVSDTQLKLWFTNDPPAAGSAKNLKFSPATFDPTTTTPTHKAVLGNWTGYAPGTPSDVVAYSAPHKTCLIISGASPTWYWTWVKVTSASFSSTATISLESPVAKPSGLVWIKATDTITAWGSGF
jgi:hypothetical protein